jgi:hypothetical protein
MADGTGIALEHIPLPEFGMFKLLVKLWLLMCSQARMTSAIHSTSVMIFIIAPLDLSHRLNYKLTKLQHFGS